MEIETTENTTVDNTPEDNSSENDTVENNETENLTEAESTSENDAPEIKAAEVKTAEVKAPVKTDNSAVNAGLNIPGKRWYAIRTITGHEKRVKNYLDTEIGEIGLEHKIAQVLIPEEKVFEVKGGKKKVKYKNFFPGYVLVEAVLDKEIINFLSHAPSVLKMVGDKNDAVALRDDEVNRILGRISDSDEVQKIDMQFEKGDLIKVVNGPFATFTGTINEINLERMKVKVMVSIFGRKTPIELDFAQIEKEK